MPELFYINIVFNPVSQKVEVNGNVMNDKLLYLGMLELAKEIVLRGKGKEKQNIIVPEIIPPPGMGKG